MSVKTMSVYPMDTKRRDTVDMNGIGVHLNIPPQEKEKFSLSSGTIAGQYSDFRVLFHQPVYHPRPIFENSFHLHEDESDKLPASTSL